MKIKFTTESGVTKYLKLGISSVLGLQDILDTKSDTDHIHSEYALTTHNHDTVYSKLTHNHDSSYADISHTHDSNISVLTSQEYEELQELEKDTLYLVIDD